MSNLLAWTKIWQDDALWVWHKWGEGEKCQTLVADRAWINLVKDQPTYQENNALPHLALVSVRNSGFSRENFSNLSWQYDNFSCGFPPTQPTKAVRQTMQGEYFCKRPPLKIFHPVIGVRPQGGSQMHCTSEADAKTSFYFNLRR